MAKVSLDVPEELHLRARKMQLDEEFKGRKVNLRDLYYELIQIGLDEKEKATHK